MSKKTDSSQKQTDKEPLPETIANLKKALEALRESEDRYRDLVENSQDLVCTHDLEGRILSLNPWAAKVLGYDMDTILQMNIRDFLAAEAREGFDAYIAKIRKRGAATGLLIVQTATGERRIWEYNNTLRTEGVTVPVVRGMARDITERKRAEEANRLHIHFLESLEQIDKAIRQETDVELMLKNVLDRVSFIFDCDRAWLFYPCDPDAPTFRVPFEISKPEYPGANTLNLEVPMDPSVAKDLRNALASEDPLAYTLGTEKQVNTLTAQQFSVQAQLLMAIYPKTGKPWVFGMHQCSHARIWTDAEKTLFKEIGRRVADGLSNVLLFRDLRESEERFRTLVNQAADAIVLHDMEGHLLSVNQRACDSLGYTKEELRGMTVADMDIEFISRNHVGAYWSQLSHDHPVTLESVYKRKDGTTFPVEVRLGLLQLEGKQSILALARDITERKQAEGAFRAHSEKLEEMVEERTHELHEAQEQLIRQEKLAVLGQLAGGVGHELRNPLAVINNAVYYLKLIQPEGSGKVKEYLGMIEKETHTAEKIISDLLDFARIKSVDREPVAVPELVQRVLTRFPAPSSVKVKFKIPTDLPLVFADPRQMEQVLGNLVVNAFQAMPQGGVLTITATKKRGEVAIVVADTGVGIPLENMQKLFEPLFTTKSKGIGLGLAVSKKLVEANSGRIEVQSKPGKGATFTVNLPLEQGFQP